MNTKQSNLNNNLNSVTVKLTRVNENLKQIKKTDRRLELNRIAVKRFREKQKNLVFHLKMENEMIKRALLLNKKAIIEMFFEESCEKINEVLERVRLKKNSLNK